ncbi:hypothetical protein ACQZ4Y_21410 [Rhizobium sp. L80/93]|nr:hypothetical protein [Rhizobium sp. L58/93]
MTCLALATVFFAETWKRLAFIIFPGAHCFWRMRLHGNTFLVPCAFNFTGLVSWLRALLLSLEHEIAQELFRRRGDEKILALDNEVVVCILWPAEQRSPNLTRRPHANA